MTTFTRRAIVEAFVELLEEKPIDRITVSELAKRCGISRNTFYYHYGDVYEVVDELFHLEEAHLLEDSGSITTVEQGLRAATRLAAEHQSAVAHIYQSTERDRLMGYLHRAAHISMGALVESRAAEMDVPREDKDAIAYLYACMLEGVVADAMRSAGERDIDQIISDACCYLDGTVALALENAARKK